jgi:hypothetical protein
LYIVDSTSRVAAVRPSTSDFQLGPGQFLAARTGESARIVKRSAALGMASSPGSRTIDTLVMLPFNYAGVAKDNRPVHLQPVIIRDSPFRYEQDRGSFRGSLLVGLEDGLAPAIRKKIDATPLTLVSEGNNVAPREVRIGYTNYPLESVIVIASAPTDSVSVRVIPSFDMRGTVVWLPVHPALVFDSPPKKAAGLGIQTVTFQVRVIGASLRESLTVTLAVDEGSLKEDRVKVGPAGSATVHLRSRGTEAAHLVATSPGIDTATATIQFGWPVSFLVAALLGGAVGGATQHVRRNTRWQTGFVRSILLGLLIGFVVSVAYYAVDVNLLPFTVTTQFFDEAAVLAFAMLGAFFGVRKVKATST